MNASRGLWASEFSTVNGCELCKDTVDDAAALNVSILGKVELDELPEAAGVIVVHGLGIPKGFHDGTASRGKAIKQNQGLTVMTCLSCILCQSVAVNFNPDAAVVQPLNTH